MKLTKQTINQKQAALIALSFNLGLMLLSVFLLVPSAMNNDDVLINYIVSGAFGEPSAVTYYNNVLFSCLLVFLHQSIGGINFLAVVEIFLLFVSLCLLSYIIIEKSSSPFGVIVAVSFSAVFGIDFYNNLQYSKIVPLVALVGVISVLYGVIEKSNVVVVVGCFIMIFSSIVRFNVFLIGAALGFWLVLFSIFKKEKGGKLQINKKLLVVFCLLFAFVFSLKAADLYFYNTDQNAKIYSEYNAARTALSDYYLPPYQDNAEQYQQLEISENDYHMIESWNFSDFEKFDVKTLSDIAAIASPGVDEFLKTVTDGVFEIIKNPLLYIMLIACFIIILLFKNKKSNILIPIFSFVFVVVLMFIMGRATRWVSAGIVASLFALLLFSLDVKTERFKQKTTLILTALLLLIVTVPTVIYCIDEAKDDYEHYFRTDLNTVHTALPQQNLYLFDIETFPAIERTQPTFSSAPKNLFDNSYILGGWDSNSPAKNSVLKRYNITGSPYKALVENDNVFLIDNHNVLSKTEFIKQNYYQDVNVSILEYIEGYPIYSFSTTPNHTELQGFPIADMADLICEANADFTTFAVQIEGEIPVSTEIEVLFEENSTEQKTSSYRAKVSDIKDGKSIVLFSAPLLDFNFFSEYTVRILTKNQNSEYFAHDRYLFNF